MEISSGMRLDRYRNHSIELVIDKLKVAAKDRDRLLASVENALTQGDKEMMVYDVEADAVAYYSQELMDPATGISTTTRLRITFRSTLRRVHVHVAKA